MTKFDTSDALLKLSLLYAFVLRVKKIKSPKIFNIVYKLERFEISINFQLQIVKDISFDNF